MDKSVVAVDESRGGSVASAVKPSGSVVGINMITIDLGCAMEEIDSPVHEHFSIRRFVAVMRKKDPKVCLPFALEGDDLPPLDIPRFRLWNCSNCVGDVCAERTGKNDHGMTKYSDIQPDEPVNVSSQRKPKLDLLPSSYADTERSSYGQTSCMQRSINLDLNEPLTERCSNGQTSCRYKGIPDLNEPFTEIPSNTQGQDFPTPSECRSSALLRFADVCEQISRERERQMGGEVVPNNIEICKGKVVTDLNSEDTRSAPDMSAANTQGKMPPHPRKIHLGGSRNRAIQPSREAMWHRKSAD